MFFLNSIFYILNSCFILTPDFCLLTSLYATSNSKHILLAFDPIDIRRIGLVLVRVVPGHMIPVRQAVVSREIKPSRAAALLRVVLRQLLRKPIREQGLEALLAVSLYRLEFTRTAAYAVVDQAVTGCGSMGWPWAKAMVNAVLRRFQRERESMLAMARAEDLGRYSYPQWWIERVRSTYPLDWQRILDGGNGPPAMSLRVNVRRGTVAQYLERLSAEGLRAHACGESAVVLERLMPVSRLPGFADGSVSVQDAGAQLAAQFLDLAPGQRVLDACAAPGGKTAHVLELCDVQLLAVDNDSMRIKRIGENLSRLGLSAQIRCADVGAPIRIFRKTASGYFLQTE